ncbi:MAG: DUF1579 family protein [Nonomuraea sp.]|nr:DUF1579 family protein [Nonomuraea sp.]NUT43159.1 DUF1579 family protein [Thermoactinospora sp.]
MTENPQNQMPTPDPSLRSLDPLVGAWEMTGKDFGTGAAMGGRLAFEWMDGGFFLIQRVEMDHGGGTMTGVEYIGYDQESKSLKSHYFDSTGNSFVYAWKLEGRDLNIWFGEEGSPAGFSGTLGEDGDSITGKWEWPGGGYEATMTRVK